MNTKPHMLCAEDVSVKAQSTGGHILNDVNLTFKQGRITALVGQSGAGKTTLALAMLGVLPDGLALSGGNISEKTIKGEVVQLNEKAGFKSTRDLGLILQNPNEGLDPAMRIGRQTEEAVKLAGISGKHEIKEASENALKRAGLEPGQIWLKYPHQLSTGMAQRVIIAISLAKPLAYLIADEPTSSLDATFAAEILNLLRELADKQGIGILLITHDLTIAAEFAEDIFILNNGEITESGPVGLVLDDPKHSFSQILIASARELLTKNDQDLPIFGDSRSVDQYFHNDHIIKVEKLRVEHRNGEKIFDFRGDRRVEIIAGVDFSVAKGRICGVVGESGSGKTTLGKSLAGLMKPASGNIMIAGRDIFGSTRHDRRSLRRSIQMVFQDSSAALDPRETVRESLLEPLKFLVEPSEISEDDHMRLILGSVELSIDTLSTRISHLSEGQRQRVLIARSLVVSPEVLVLDEPFTALDPILKFNLIKLIKDLRIKLGLTIILISHDLSSIQKMADDLLIIYLGAVVEEGPSKEILDTPFHPYTEILRSITPDSLQSARSHVPNIIPLKGEMPSFAQPPKGCRFHTRCPIAQGICRDEVPLLISLQGIKIGESIENVVSIEEKNRTGLVSDLFGLHRSACHFAGPFPIRSSSKRF